MFVEVSYIVFFKILDIIVLIFFFLFVYCVFRGKKNRYKGYYMNIEKYKCGKMNLKYKEKGWYVEEIGESIKLFVFNIFIMIKLRLIWG